MSWQRCWFRLCEKSSRHRHRQRMRTKQLLRQLNLLCFGIDSRPFFCDSVRRRRCGEMADAQDLKSWDLKKSCRFESGHRHQFNVRRSGGSEERRKSPKLTKFGFLPKAATPMTAAGQVLKSPSQTIQPFPQKILESFFSKTPWTRRDWPLRGGHDCRLQK